MAVAVLRASLAVASDGNDKNANATHQWHQYYPVILATRLLAADYGTTINLSKTYDSGVTLGTYAAFTSAGNKCQVPSAKYGEGSFNNGIYLTIPFDIFYTKSSRSSVTAQYTPLTRDGDASLNRQYKLYSLTGMRDLNRYWDGFKKGN